MTRKRDRYGRYLPAEGEVREKVVRVTPSEYKALLQAREKGTDPKKELEQVKQGNK
jgi:hypothetical protein